MIDAVSFLLIGIPYVWYVQYISNYIQTRHVHKGRLGYGHAQAQESRSREVEFQVKLRRYTVLPHWGKEPG